jgi:chromosome segregation protein
MHAWQLSWEDFNRRAADPAQIAQVERTRIAHLEQQEQQGQRRLERLTEELGRMAQPHLEEELGELEQREQELEEQQAAAQDGLEAANRDIQTLRSSLAGDNRRLDEVKQALQSRLGRRASLETLQQAALRSGGKVLQAWLRSAGLEQAGRLAESLEVEAPWQRATELVLGPRLQALCTASLDRQGADLARLTEGPLELFDAERRAAAGPPPPPDSLAAHVRSPLALDGLLHGVKLADNLTDALQRRSTLGPDETLEIGRAHV